MRLDSAARCFERYRKELWSPPRLVADFEYADGPGRLSVPPSEAQAPPPLSAGLRSWSAAGAVPFEPPNRSAPRPAPAFRAVNWPQVSRRAH